MLMKAYLLGGRVHRDLLSVTSRKQDLPVPLATGFLSVASSTKFILVEHGRFPLRALRDSPFKVVTVH